jgi:hypothetical protein
MRLCYVAGEPLARCHGNGDVTGLAVDYIENKLGGTSEFDVTCANGSMAALMNGCDIISGTVNTYVLSRIPSVVYDEYSIGQAFAGSSFAVVFAPQFDDSSFIFFRPFSSGVWILLAAATVVAVLAMIFVRSSTTRRASATRDGIMSLLGYSRLYKGKDPSYFQHAISILTAIFSVIIVSMYSSNLVARSYISSQQTPDLTTKTVAYQRGRASRWFAKTYPEHVSFEADVTLPDGSPNVTLFEGVERGEYFVFTDTLVVDALCAARPDMSLIAADIFGLTMAYAPLVKNTVRSDVFAALVYEPAMNMFHARAERACFHQNEAYVRGFGVYDTWTIFTFVGSAAAALVVVKLAFVLVGRMTNDVPHDRDVIQTESRRRASGDDPESAWQDVAL